MGVFDASTSPPKECPLLAALIRPKRRREVGNVSVCISAFNSLQKFGPER